MVWAPSLLASIATILAVQSGASTNACPKPAATLVPPKLEPLRPERPTPAQRIMPGLH